MDRTRKYNKVLLVPMALIGLIALISLAYATGTYEEYQEEVKASYHGQLGSGLDNAGMLEKWCSLPNFNLEEQGLEAWTSSCGSCHISGGFEYDEDDGVYTPKDVDCSFCHASDNPIEDSSVTVESCVDNQGCHLKDKAKRGDVFDGDHDIHLAADMTCQDCHPATEHQIAKGMVLDTSEVTYEGTMEGCEECHAAPHADRKYDKHAKTIACEVCHTGERDAGITLATRTWAEFNEVGTPVTTKHMDTWRPEYKWYSPDAVTSIYPILDYTEHMDAKGAKITPFNAVDVTFFAKSEDDHFDAIIVPDVKAADANSNRVTTVDEMRAYAGGAYDYSEAVLVTETMNFQISHGVLPKTEALTCDDCHGEDSWAIDWEQLGYDDEPYPGSSNKQKNK